MSPHRKRDRNRRRNEFQGFKDAYGAGDERFGEKLAKFYADLDDFFAVAWKPSATTLDRIA